MLTPAEIEEAIARLPVEDREDLEERLIARHFLSAEDLAELQSSLERAEAEIDCGDCATPDEARTLVRSWLGK